MEGMKVRLGVGRPFQKLFAIVHVRDSKASTTATAVRRERKGQVSEVGTE